MKTEKSPSIINRYKPYIGKKTNLLYWSMFLSTVSAICKIALPVIVWLTIRLILKDPIFFSFKDIIPYAIALGVFSLSAILFYFLSLMLSHIAAFNTEINIQKKSVEKLIKLPLGFYDNQETGRIRKIINDSASDTHIFLAHQLPDNMSAYLTPFILLIAIVVVDWKMGFAIITPFFISTIIMSCLMTKNAKKFMSFYFSSLEDLSTQTVEYIRGIPVIKTFGNTVYTFSKYLKTIFNYKKWVTKYTLIWRFPMSIIQVLLNSYILFLVPLCIILISKGYNIQEVITNYLFYLLVSPVFANWLARTIYVKQNKETAKKIIDKLEELIPLVIDNKEYKSFKLNTPEIEFKNVSFKYPKSDIYVLKNVSFKILKNQTCALVGPSGGGKSSIIKLLAKFYTDYEGDIYIDKTELREIKKDDLMDNFSFIFQNNNLFKASIKENLTLGKCIEEDRINEALSLASANKIIDNLENGLESIYKSNNCYLSGGEIQRLALARAFIKKSPFLILDEATAFADPENEDEIYSSINKLSNTSTTLLIMHRFKNMKKLDNIFVIDDGKIVESGNHDILLKNSQLYKKLYEEYNTAVKWTFNSKEVK